MEFRGQLVNIDDVKRYVFAGKATITVVSCKTQVRFTFKVSRPDETTPWFVSVLNGSDNESDFAYLGYVSRDGNYYAHGTKSRISATAPCALAAQWTFKNIISGILPSNLEIWHEGHCCRCGRKLTVPSSIEHGVGPECRKKLGMSPLKKDIDLSLPLQ
jgi:hypothetical protein